MTSPIPSRETMQTIYVCNQALAVLDRVKAYLGEDTNTGPLVVVSQP